MPEKREQVLEPFHRPAGRGEGGGRGLARQITQRHGGQVTCESDGAAASSSATLLRT